MKTEYEIETAIEVWKRDKGRCVLCDEKADDIHEIIPRSAFGKKNMDECFHPTNRVCLCRKCHTIAHTKQIKLRLQTIMKEN